ncbi:ceramide glucosyltransferase [Lindgomyces ingoldianus]|uniref:Ceramide glucosyltransferase n=1 Tax=Lindgomyces ingoldianus TaxID=673940 RepID=A0ACB6QLI9_9PLEO|nr:ceramide glucosyltransferase [Lindgomyces ingoldianus]KAF2467879.1 ceramide glucosyltransferase [Lindgomyces ingoldianus]
MVRIIIAAICLMWYIVVWLVCAIGFTQLCRYYSKRPQPASCLRCFKEEDLPHVTIIRPAKGLEPRLYECLAATFRQTYPRNKLTIYFCVSSRSDPAFPILDRLMRDFPGFDAKILVEEEDPLANNHGSGLQLGPNPKIRNMSRAYREAKGDIVWVIDCNVWVGKGVCGRMVDLLCGYGGEKPFKFVHQLPLSIDMDGEGISTEERKLLLGGEQVLDGDIAASTSSDHRNHSRGRFKRLLQRGGGRLDEAFLSSAHAKFYVAINTVLVAPCSVGKSNMFRRSHLNYLTQGNPDRAPGIDFFSDNICEDHLIGDALWKKPQAFEQPGYQPSPGEHVEAFGKHSLLFGDMCFQPISHTSVSATISRRVRWLRVRKFTVTLATFVEPGTEAIVHGLYGAYALTTLPSFANLGISSTWSSFFMVWFCSMIVWCLVDWLQYLLLHSAKSVELDSDTPDFILPQRSPGTRSSPSSHQPLLDNKGQSTPGLLAGNRRGFRQFWFAWIIREISALPIWVWAFWGGVTVNWRGKSFWVGMDMKVHEILPKK